MTLFIQKTKYKDYKKFMYITVIDKQHREILCSGEFKQIKYAKQYKFLSIDEIYFFNENSKKFLILKDYLEKYIPFTKLEYLNNYNCVKWNKRFICNNDKFVKHPILSTDKYLIDPSTIDIYIEQPYDEECIPLIKALNKINGIETIGSCSGHDKRILFIELKITKLKGLIFIQTHLPKEFKLTTKNTFKYNQNFALFDLRTIVKGNKAYIAANKFAEDINNSL